MEVPERKVRQLKLFLISKIFVLLPDFRIETIKEMMCLNVLRVKLSLTKPWNKEIICFLSFVIVNSRYKYEILLKSWCVAPGFDLAFLK